MTQQLQVATQDALDKALRKDPNSCPILIDRGRFWIRESAHVEVSQYVSVPQAEYPFKIKARRVTAPIYEVDCYGHRVNGERVTV